MKLYKVTGEVIRGRALRPGSGVWSEMRRIERTYPVQAWIMLYQDRGWGAGRHHRRRSGSVVWIRGGELRGQVVEHDRAGWRSQGGWDGLVFFERTEWEMGDIGTAVDEVWVRYFAWYLGMLTEVDEGLYCLDGAGG